MKVIISAGGTGGHIYPALAIINKIKEKDKTAEILYIGTTERMEKDLIPNMGINYEGIKARGLSKNPIKALKSINMMLKSVNKCKEIMKKFKPDIVIGVGGYVTVPVVLAAHKLGIKVILHEQNSIPGKANRFLSKYAEVVCTSMECSNKYFKNALYTGNPRAEEVTKVVKAKKSDYGLSVHKKLVLITTGSLGSSTVNNTIIEMLSQFKNKSYEVLLVTGNSSYEKYKKLKTPENVHIAPYIENMLELLRATDLIVSRAGATTIAEITALGLPSILIPSPYVVNNHQYLNALELKENEACILIEEKDLNKDILFNNIEDIMNNIELYKKLSKNSKKMGTPDSATKIYEQIKTILNK